MTERILVIISEIQLININRIINLLLVQKEGNDNNTFFNDYNIHFNYKKTKH